MSAHQLAPVAWRSGQVLLPAHFLAERQALWSSVQARFVLSGLPAWGVAEFSHAEQALLAGELRLRSLLAVFRDGTLVRHTDNCQLDGFPLAGVQQSSCTLYLHLLEQSETIAIEQSDRSTLDHLLYRVCISPSRVVTASRQSLPLCEVVSTPGGWKLGTQVPPLLQVGRTPFLQEVLRRLEQGLAELQRQLEVELEDTFIRGEQRASVRRTQATAQKLRCLLAEVNEGIVAHPYVVFSELRDLVLDLCAFRDAAPPDLARLQYQHEEPGVCFGRLIDAFEKHAVYRTRLHRRIEFVERDVRLVADNLPTELLKASEVYLLLRIGQRTSVPLGRLKLASPSRLPTVYENALEGIPLVRQDASAFLQTFGSRVEVFRLVSGKEWDAVRIERSICFVPPDGVDRKAALMWAE